MSFSYTRMSNEECEKERGFSLLDPGIYNFEVISATYDRAKTSGNPMVKLRLRVWGNDGKDYAVFDNLLATPKMMWKTRHFCDSVGLTKEYDDGKFNENLCQGKCGKAMIEIQEAQNGYPAKNSIKDYVMTDNGSLEYKSLNESDLTFKKDFQDEDIPF